LRGNVHIIEEYLALIDRTVHLAHVAAVSTSILDGNHPPVVIPFPEDLTYVHDELQSVFLAQRTFFLSKMKRRKAFMNEYYH
jgi:hypothetical protein